jgi:hypothetical protein
VVRERLRPGAAERSSPHQFGADAAHFTDEERALAAQRLGEAFEVYGGRYYQLGLDSPATVVLLLLAETLRTVAPEVLGHVLFEALRHLLPNRARKFVARGGSGRHR